jgi:hypothetical protein
MPSRSNTPAWMHASRQMMYTVIHASMGLSSPPPLKPTYPIAREALLANKHVYVEKPLVLVEKEAEALIQLASKRASGF